MGDLAEFRGKFPQYDDLADDALADALHQKYYSDLPKETVYGKLGVALPKAAAAPASAPAVQYETQLSPTEESQFQQWKAQNAPTDTGADYDLRGAFKAGIQPAGPEAGANQGHWPDTFKKPNHPTFSVESQYAKDRPDLAGRWEGDKYVAPVGPARMTLGRGGQPAVANPIDYPTVTSTGVMALEPQNPPAPPPSTLIEQRGAPVAAETFQAEAQRQATATPEQAAAAREQPGYAGSVAKSATRALEQGARTDFRRQELVHAGAAPVTAENIVGTESTFGVKPQAPQFADQQAGTEYMPAQTEEDAARKEWWSKRSSGVRGITKGVLNIAAQSQGLADAAYEAMGAPSPSAKQNYGALKGFQDSIIGAASADGGRHLEGILESTITQVPWLALGIARGAATIPLLAMGLGQFGDTYSEARAAGVDVNTARLKGGIFAAAEVLGELVGVNYLTKGFAKMLEGIPPEHLKARSIEFLTGLLEREIPGELGTTTAEFIADKWGPGGLHPEWTARDYAQQIVDTIIQTAGQVGLMGAAGSMAGGFIGKRPAGEQIGRALQEDVNAAQFVPGSAEAEAIRRLTLDPARAAAARATVDRLEAQAALAGGAPVAPPGGPAPGTAGDLKRAMGEPGKPLAETRQEDATLALQKAQGEEAAAEAERLRVEAEVDAAFAQEEADIAAEVNLPTISAAGAAADKGQLFRTAPEDAVTIRPGEVGDLAAAEDAAARDGSPKAPIIASTPEDVAAAAERTADAPSPKQIEADNFAKGRFEFSDPLKAKLGMIAIETKKGGTRTAKDGSWSVPNFPAHYGHLPTAMGNDGDKADVFIGDAIDSPVAFVIDQVNLPSRDYDETKSFVGFPTKEAAINAYASGFSDGKGLERIGAITEMPIAQFVNRARADNLKKAVAYVKPKETPNAIPAVPEGKQQEGAAERNAPDATTEATPSERPVNEVRPPGAAQPAAEEGAGGPWPVSNLPVPRKAEGLPAEALTRDEERRLKMLRDDERKLIQGMPVAEDMAMNDKGASLRRLEAMIEENRRLQRELTAPVAPAEAVDGWTSYPAIGPGGKASGATLHKKGDLLIRESADKTYFAVAKKKPGIGVYEELGEATTFEQAKRLAEGKKPPTPQVPAMPGMTPLGARPATGGEAIGKNADGQDIFEDARGVRSIVQDGVRISQTVEMVPTRAPNGGVEYKVRPTGEDVRFVPVEQKKNGKPSFKIEGDMVPPEVRGEEPKSPGEKVKDLALAAQREAGWNTDWPFVPADLQNADFRRLLQADPDLSVAEKQAIFAAGRKLGVVPKQEAAPAALTAEQQADADIAAALDELGDLLGKNTRLNITPEQEQKLFPILTKLFDAAFRKGYIKFKQAARFVRDTIAKGLGQGVADQLTLDHYQGAYISTAGRYRDQGAENAAAVAAVQSLEEDKSDEHTSTGDTGKEALGGMAPGAGEGAEGGGPVRGGDARGGDAGAAGDTGPAAEGVSTPRSGGSGAETSYPAGPGTGGGRGGRGKGRTRRTGSGVPAAPAGVIPETPNIPGANFRITDEVRLGQGGEAEKFRDNLAAIKTLKNIEADNRRATPEEQRILARYVGWGGLANAFADEGNPLKDDWKARGTELAELLTPQELRSARRTTRNAHFTSETIIDAMWDGVLRLGFKGGMMLEHSMGAGNFIGLMPGEVTGSTNVIGVEYDSLTSRIAALLYPQAAVLHAGFQKVPVPDGEFALNIGNPPFGQEKLRFQFKPGLNHLSIHNQFMLAGQDALRPGGIQAMVVSRYMMDQVDSSAREEMATKVKLLGAIRLPDTAFRENARTDVVTDMLFFQRLTPAEQSAMEDAVAAKRRRPEKKREDEAKRERMARMVPSWTETTKVPDPLGGADMTVNSYFSENPDMIMGVLERSGKMQAKGEEGKPVNVRLEKGASLKDMLAWAIDQLPENAVTEEPDAIARAAERFKSLADALRIVVAGHESGAILLEDGKLTQIIDRETPSGDFELTKRELNPDSPWSQQFNLDKNGKWYRLEVQTDASGKPVKQEKNGKQTKFNAFTRTTYENEADVPDSLRLGAARFETLKLLIRLRDLHKAQIVMETGNVNTAAMEANRKKLAYAYEKFVQQHGFLHLPKNASLISEMPDEANIISLELSYRPELTPAMAKRMREKPRPASVTPSPILKERQLMPYAPPGKADTPADALAISLAEFGRVDLPRMASLLGITEDEVIAQLFTEAESPLIYQDPETSKWETSDNYLSGQVRRKLEAARAAGLQKNADALAKVQPEPWGSDKVTAIIGASWIPTETYQDFLRNLTGADSTVRHAAITNSYMVVADDSTQKAKEWSSPMATMSWIVTRMLNSQSLRITTKDEDGRTIFWEEETALAILKAKEIESAFADWVFSDRDRRTQLVGIFNDKFNTRVQRQHAGQHLILPGKVPDATINMRRHQKNTIWRGISERFMLMDHVVGSGKTYTYIAIAMERRRMGLSRKPMIIVPNHLVAQTAAAALRLYPGANVLAVGKADLQRKRRRRGFAKIATGDWDLVIMPESASGFVGIAPETEERFLDEELRIANQAIEDAWEAAREDGTDGGRFKPFTVKEAERLAEKIQTRLDGLRHKTTDRLLTFEQMGIDLLMVDEAHSFKNLFYSSRLSGVSGMNVKVGSQKAFDLYTKIRVLRESPTGAVIFGTGTPISNSAVEMYQMMRYLAADEMRDLGLEHFDAWRAQYVDINTKWEPTESGRLKEVNRLGRSWSNMRSLMDLYYSFTDSVTQEDIDKAYAEDNNGAQFPIPKVKGGKRQEVVVKPTEAQSEQLAGILAGFDGLAGIQDYRERNKERLRLMDRAKKVSLDARMLDPRSESKEEGGKLDTVARKAADIYRKWDADKGTQLIFLDRGVKAAKQDKTVIKAYDAAIAERDQAMRSGDEEAYRKAVDKLDAFDPNEIAELKRAAQGGWNAYDQLKANLVAQGIPENEIRFIGEANTDLQKQAIFDAVNAGEIRILIGSTPKMGAGTNVQRLLVALHHVDVTWKPSDIEQREGRILRQDNALYLKYPNFEVEILAYVTERTVDAKLWDVNSTKLRTINGIRKYGGEFNMDFEDEEAVGMAEIAALASGDPLLLERVKVTSEIDKFELLERAFRRKQVGYEDEIEEAERVIRTFPAQIVEENARAAEIDAHLKKIEERARARRVTVEGKEYASHFDAAKAARDAIEVQQAGNENARYSISVNGIALTNKEAIEDAISNAIGDATAFEASIQGAETGRRLVATRTLTKRANEMLDGLGDEPKSMQIGTIMGYKARLQVRKGYGGTPNVSITLTDEKGSTLGSDYNSIGDKKQTEFSGQTVRKTLDQAVDTVIGKRAASTSWMEDRIVKAKENLPRLKSHEGDTFDKAAELEAKRARLQEIISQLAVTATPPVAATDVTDDEEESKNVANRFEAIDTGEEGEVSAETPAARDIDLDDKYSTAAVFSYRYLENEDAISDGVIALAKQIAPQANTEVVRQLFAPTRDEFGIPREMEVSGLRRASENLIAVSLRYEDPKGALRHEAVHSFFDMGLLSGAEQRALKARAPGWRTEFDIDKRYKHLMGRETDLNEEGMADAYKAWGNGQKFGGFIGPAFSKIRRFLQGLGDLLRRKGFTKVADIFPNMTAEDVFARMESGEVGRRTGKRSLTVGDKSAVSPLQTMTAAFKRWFGDSKVVDAEGKPLVVYHGTASDHSVFDAGHAGKYFDNPVSRSGFFFAPEKSVAEAFAEYAVDDHETITGKQGRARVVAAYLSLQRPLEIDGEVFGATRYDTEELAKLLNSAKEDGYDGAIIKNWNDGSGAATQYVAFRPEQIKSAIGNVGTFDPNNPDIRYSIPEEPITTRVHGVEDVVLDREMLTPERTQGSIEHAKRIFDEVGLDVVERGAGLWDVADKGADNDEAGYRLLEALRREIRNQNAGPESPEIASLLTSVAEYVASGDNVGMSAPLRIKLYGVAQGERSHRGLLLGALAQHSPESMNRLARNIEGALERVYAQTFDVSAEVVQSTLDDVMRRLRDQFTDDDLAKIAEASPDLMKLIDRLSAAPALKDIGGRLYRKVQFLFKDKKAKTFETLAEDARVNEAVQKIIDDLKQFGIEPKEQPGKKVLTQIERLMVMVNPETSEMIDERIAQAIVEAERNAGIAATMAEASPDERDLMREAFRKGLEPSPEMVERGMQGDDFLHWRMLRDNLLGYSPTTLKLVQQVVQGTFKGTKFGQKAPKPVDVRIDINKLARSPAKEVQRVLDESMKAIEEEMLLNDATPETLLRVSAMLQAQVVAQLEAARARVRDQAFAAPAPKPGQPLTADQRLRELFNAGLLKDQRLDAAVAAISKKSAVRRLMPNLGEMVKKVFATRFYRQGELQNRFGRALSLTFDLSEPERKNAEKLFAAAFADQFAKAKAKALDTVHKSLTPKQQTTVSKVPKLWEKIERAVNAGAFDSAFIMQEVALSRGWTVPTDAQLEEIRDLANREQELRELTDGERATAEREGRVKEAEQEKADAFEVERNKLKREMQSLWSRWSMPINMWSAKGQENTARAARELTSANMLLRVGFVARQTIDVGTQLVLYTPTRATMHALSIYKNDKMVAGRETRLLRDLGVGLKDAYGQRRKVLKQALSMARGAAVGRVRTKNVEQILEAISVFDRAELKADELAAQGRTGQALLLRWSTNIAQAGFTYSRMLDVFQGTLIEAQERHSRVIRALRASGMTAEQASQKADWVVGDINAEFMLALARTRQMHEAMNMDTSEAALRQSAWDVVTGRQYGRIAMLKVLPDDFKTQMQLLKNIYGWNEKEHGSGDDGHGGPGGWIAESGKILQDVLVKSRIPLLSWLPFTNFSNAMGIAANRALTWAGFGFLSSSFKGSPFYQNEDEILHRKIEASVGMSFSLMALALVWAGILIPWYKWPEDEVERELWKNMPNGGRQPGTVDLMIGGGKYITFSMTVGPFSILRPWLVGAAALQDFSRKREQKEKKLIRRAEEQGLTPAMEEQRGLDLAAAVAWGFGSTLIGGRTASGMIANLSNYNTPGASQLTRSAAGMASPMVPGLPQWQEISRALGVQLDPKRASVLDFMFPTAGTAAEKRNFFYDPINEVTIARVTKVLTGGTWPLATLPIHKDTEKAYRVLYETGWRPPGVQNQAREIGDQYRAFDQDELEKYRELRGRYLKKGVAEAKLDGLTENEKLEELDAVAQEANQDAIDDVIDIIEARTGGTGASPKIPALKTRPTQREIRP